MPPRATWKGQLKISLVAMPVRMHNATTSTSRIHLNQLHKECHQRLKQQMICPEHGPVDRSEIVKGYEYEKNHYVVINDDDLEQIKLETNKTIEITQFVDADELDQKFIDAPYYLAPDGPVAEGAFRVMREALRETGKVGVGRVVIANRERIVALQVEGAGFLLSTLRFADEVRNADPYFEGVGNGDVSQDELKLAKQLIEHQSRPLDTSEFADRYQDGLLAVIKAKVDGAEPVVVEEQRPATVINLMDALKASLPEGKAKKPPAKSIKTSAAKKKAKRA